jgi:hypothetical protein
LVEEAAEIESGGIPKAARSAHVNPGEHSAGITNSEEND